MTLKENVVFSEVRFVCFFLNDYILLIFSDLSSSARGRFPESNHLSKRMVTGKLCVIVLPAKEDL